MNQNVKWTIVIICLMLIWFSIVTLFYLKADEVTKNPCSICSEKMGEKVVCTQTETDYLRIPARITFFPNGSSQYG